MTDGTFTECTMEYNRASLPTLEVRPSGLHLGMEYNEAAQVAVVTQVTGRDVGEVVPRVGGAERGGDFGDDDVSGAGAAGPASEKKRLGAPSD